MKIFLRTLMLVGSLAACSTATVPPAAAQQKAPSAPALAVAPLAGQRVPVLPFTLITADPSIEATLPADRVVRLAWADSIMAEVLLERGGEEAIPATSRHRPRGSDR